MYCFFLAAGGGIVLGLENKGMLHYPFSKGSFYPPLDASSSYQSRNMMIKHLKSEPDFCLSVYSCRMPPDITSSAKYQMMIFKEKVSFITS